MASMPQLDPSSSPIPPPPPTKRAPRQTRVASKSQSRSRSPSPPPISDDDDGDGVDPSLLGQDGLHAGQHVTPARLRHPGKYTDKSMRQAHSKRSRARERTAADPSVMAENQHVAGTCVNDYGSIKPCGDLVTRVNLRPTFVNRDRLPLQMLYAMLLDEQPEIVRTYDGALVRKYLAGVIGRALQGGDALEPYGWKNLFRFAVHTVNLLSQNDAMTGDTDPITVIAERYLQPHLEDDLAYLAVRESIRELDDEDAAVLDILDNLRTLVDETIPYVRLWAYNTQSQDASKTVLLRRGQLKSHPWDRLKEDLDRSIEMFIGGDGSRHPIRPLPETSEPKRRGRPRGGGRNGGVRRAENQETAGRGSRRSRESTTGGGDGGDRSSRSPSPPPPPSTNQGRAARSLQRGGKPVNPSRRGRGGVLVRTGENDAASSPLENDDASFDLSRPPRTPGHFLDDET